MPLRSSALTLKSTHHSLRAFYMESLVHSKLCCECKMHQLLRTNTLCGYPQCAPSALGWFSLMHSLNAQRHSQGAVNALTWGVLVEQLVQSTQCTLATASFFPMQPSPETLLSFQGKVPPRLLQMTFLLFQENFLNLHLTSSLCHWHSDRKHFLPLAH